MKKNAFSLIELMIVITIIGILAAIAIPSYMRYLQRAKFTEIISALKIFKTNAIEHYNVNQTFNGFNEPGTSNTGSNYLTVVFYNGTSSGLQIGGQAQNLSSDINTKYLYMILNADPSGSITTCCGIKLGGGANIPQQHLPNGCNNICTPP